jgi:hypothetical protein
MRRGTGDLVFERAYGDLEIKRLSCYISTISYMCSINKTHSSDGFPDTSPINSLCIRS